MTEASLADPREPLLAAFEEPTRDDWLEAAEKLLRGVPFEKALLTPTVEGVTLRPIYDRADVEGVGHRHAFPGAAPYLRGGQASGHAREPWSVAQEIPYATPRRFNEAACSDLERGQTALGVVLDRATLDGRDPDRADAADVGVGGLSLATVADVADAFAGIDLTEVPIRVGAGAQALPVLSLLVAQMRREGGDPARLRGGVEADPLGALAARGDLPCSLEAAYDEMAALVQWGAEHAPALGIAGADGSVWADGGASAVEELAFVVATGAAYLRAMHARGLDADRVAPRISLTFRVGSHTFMEVAKLRAARLVWARVVAAFGGSPASQRAAIRARTGWWNKTRYDPWVNLVRTTTEAFAAVVGGVDALHVGSFDEVVGMPDERSRRLARNIQLILREEARLARVIDPAGGSWHVESLTDEVARASWRLFQEVEARGGMGAALLAGFPQERVGTTAAERRRRVATGEDVLVGVNRYADPEEARPEPGPAEPGGGRETLDEVRTERVRASADHRRARNAEGAEPVDRALAALAGVASGPGADPARVEAAVEAARAGATLGEIADTMRAVPAERVRATPVVPGRGAEPFESIRLTVDAAVARGRVRPRAFLARLGAPPEHRARADFARGFLEVGGFEVVGDVGFETPGEAARAATAAGAEVVVICSTDEIYGTSAGPLAEAVKAERAGTAVVVAGRPGEDAEGLRAAGVDDFLHLRADIHQFHVRLQQRLGLGG